MSTVRELFAPRFMKGRQLTEEEQNAMAAELGADSLFYLPLEAVARCIGLDADRLCRACLTGEYPTPTGERLYQAGAAQPQRHVKNSHLRTRGRCRAGVTSTASAAFNPEPTATAAAPSPLAPG